MKMHRFFVSRARNEGWAGRTLSIICVTGVEYTELLTYPLYTCISFIRYYAVVRLVGLFWWVAYHSGPSMGVICID